MSSAARTWNCGASSAAPSRCITCSCRAREEHRWPPLTPRPPTRSTSQRPRIPSSIPVLPRVTAMWLCLLFLFPCHSGFAFQLQHQPKTRQPSPRGACAQVHSDTPCLQRRTAGARKPIQRDTHVAAVFLRAGMRQGSMDAPEETRRQGAHDSTAASAGAWAGGPAKKLLHIKGIPASIDDEYLKAIFKVCCEIPCTQVDMS